MSILSAGDGPQAVAGQHLPGRFPPPALGSCIDQRAIEGRRPHPAIARTLRRVWCGIRGEAGSEACAVPRAYARARAHGGGGADGTRRRACSTGPDIRVTEPPCVPAIDPVARPSPRTVRRSWLASRREAPNCPWGGKGGRGVGARGRFGRPSARVGPAPPATPPPPPPAGRRFQTDGAPFFRARREAAGEGRGAGRAAGRPLRKPPSRPPSAHRK